MILTGAEIVRAVRSGEIHIDPFDESQVNPNSYNYRLGRTLLRPANAEFDSRKTPAWESFEIPSDGFVLRPHSLHLGSTVERFGSFRYVPSLIGRSSLGRLGLFVQITADLGNLGAVHGWTLELHCVQPLRIYPGMKLGQISFWSATGAVTLYDGDYSSSSLPTPNIVQDVSVHAAESSVKGEPRAGRIDGSRKGYGRSRGCEI